MKRILLTGGAGFIGSHLVKKFLGLSYRVLVIDDLSFGKRDLLPLFDAKLEFVKGDITDKVLLANILEKFRPEIIVHLAAVHFIPYCINHPARTSEVNIMGTRNLLEYCRKVRPEVLFFASSAAVYPISAEANDENTPVGPTDIYGLTKVVGEDLARLLCRETGVRTIVARLFNVYGANETNPHVIPEIVDQVKSGSREIELGNLSPKRDYVHVQDVVDAIMALLEKSERRFDIFNVGSGRDYSVSEIIEQCKQVIGEELGIRQSKNRIRKSERMHLLADITKIQEATGWSPKIGLRDGLQELLMS